MALSKMMIPALTALSFASLAIGHPTHSAGQYSLIADYSGDNFFSGFETYTGPDPTNGHIKYLSMQDASREKLLAFIRYEAEQSTHAYIGVDHINQAPNGRNSARLTSKQTFDIGTLAVMDIVHAPTGPGTWGAYWFLGSQGQWPASGEIDVFEQVHDQDHAATTLHTAPGCRVDNASTTFQGTLVTSDCNENSAATGCSVDSFAGVQTPHGRLATAGDAFNRQGGGVFVSSWTPTGITVWMFARDALPADLAAGAPHPAAWPAKPLAHFAGPGCDFTAAFASMNAILNVDLCGDWAGRVWDSSGMAQKTGVATCADYVSAHPDAFREAYFEIASFKVYAEGRPGAPAAAAKREEVGEMPAFAYVDPAGEGRNRSRDASPSAAAGRHAHHLAHAHAHLHAPTRNGTSPPFANGTAPCSNGSATDSLQLRGPHGTGLPEL